MKKEIRQITLATLAMALIPGLWNIVVAIVLTLFGDTVQTANMSFFEALWYKFNNFGSIESFLADIAFFVVALWQGYRLSKLTEGNRSKAKQLVLISSGLAAALHLVMHFSMGFFLLSDVRIALSIIAGALIGMFLCLHHHGRHAQTKPDLANL